MIEIILSLITLLSSCGWVLERKKYLQEVRRSKVEVSREEFDLSAQYVQTFKQEIYEPLQEELHKLRQAMDRVADCMYRDQCPVLDQLHNHEQGPTT